VTTNLSSSAAAVESRDPELRLRSLVDRGTLCPPAPGDDCGRPAGRGAVDDTPAIAFAGDGTRGTIPP